MMQDNQRKILEELLPEAVKRYGKFFGQNTFGVYQTYFDQYLDISGWSNDGSTNLRLVAPALIVEACRLAVLDKYRMLDDGYRIGLMQNDEAEDWAIYSDYDSANPYDRARAALECLLKVEG